MIDAIDDFCDKLFGAGEYNPYLDDDMFPVEDEEKGGIDAVDRR
jgi:hypothetical protein